MFLSQRAQYQGAHIWGCMATITSGFKINTNSDFYAHLLVPWSNKLKDSLTVNFEMTTEITVSVINNKYCKAQVTWPIKYICDHTEM